MAADAGVVPVVAPLAADSSNTADADADAGDLAGPLLTELDVAASLDAKVTVLCWITVGQIAAK